MSEIFYFGKELKVYLENSSGQYWRIELETPATFTQSAAHESVAVQTMPQINSSQQTSSHHTLKRFKTEFNAADWSFTTNIRPYRNGSDKQSAESILWEYFTGASETVSGDTDNQFSLKETYPTFTLYFMYPNNKGYKMTGCVITKADIAVDMASIGKIQWSGLGLKLEEATLSPPTIQNTNHLASGTYITNKLSTLTSTNSATTFSFPLTALAVNLAVNHAPIATPIIEELSYPVGFSRKEIQISGTFNAYAIDTGVSTGKTRQFFANILADSTPVEDIALNIGGTTTNKSLTVVIPQADFEVPSLETSDVLSIGCNFFATSSGSLGTNATTLTQIKYN